MNDALLYAGIVPFDSLRQRPQWLAEELSRRTRVLYLEPNASPLRGHLARPALSERSESLACFEPGTAWPLSGYWRPVNRVNQRRVAHLVQGAAQELGWRLTRVLCSFPKHVDLLPHLGPPQELESLSPSSPPGGSRMPVLYDVMDDYPAFFGRREARVLAAMHGELLRQADSVTASSETLASELNGGTEARVELLENAVPADFAARVSAARPANRSRFPRPCFGYVGVLASWLDYEAVNALANAYPEGSVVLVGPRHCELPAFPGNVIQLGERPHAELPGLLSGMDVGLVPFQVERALHAVNPVKVYEYLAAGLPVLATPCAELRRFPVGVEVLAASKWAAGARALLKHRIEPEALRASVAQETWEERARKLWSLLEQVGACGPPARGDGCRA